ncbi:PH domain-containing protein [Candidatus Poribacteria bacterium]|nr:PH domain-containing protein [Candidatus Poribacteria bacterium]
MYEALKRTVLAVLKVPPEPDDPMGEVGSLRVFRAAPNYFRYRLVSWGIGQFFAVGGALVGLAVLHAVFVAAKAWWTNLLLLAEFAGLVVVVSQTLFSFVTLKLDYEMRWYKVTDRSLRIREGVFFVREMTMTFANIQNISITQGPLQRFLGIADLKVQTAGGGGGAAGAEGHENQSLFNMHVGYFRGVANAEEIRDLMRERLRRYRDTGLGDTDERHHAESVAAAQGVVDIVPAVRELCAEAAGLRRAGERLVQRSTAG